MAEYRFEIDREIKTCDDCPMCSHLCEFLDIESFNYCNLLEDISSRGEKCSDCPLKQM